MINQTLKVKLYTDDSFAVGDMFFIEVPVLAASHPIKLKGADHRYQFVTVARDPKELKNELTNDELKEFDFN